MALDAEQAAPKMEISQTPYQLDLAQTKTACRVLLQHMTEEKKRIDSGSAKPNLLTDEADSDSDEGAEQNETAIWLIVTTKKHIVDQKRLKPNKIKLPHSLNNAETTICLITADPQDRYKTLVEQDSFPASLRKRVNRVISYSHLKKDFKSFESRRKLLSEHDIFLADDRIVTYLPQTLGKTFYKAGSKRPVPINIAEPRERDADGKRARLDPASGRKINRDKIEGGRGAASPEVTAKEIEKATQSALVHLAPGVSTAVKVATAGFKPEMVCDNLQTVVNEMAEKIISKGWRNIKALHIKGPNTMAFPIWLASELWVDEQDVLEEPKTYGGNKGKKATEKRKKIAAEPGKPEKEVNRTTHKRKAEDTSKPDVTKHAKKKRKPEPDDKLATEKALRKQKLKQQKKEAFAAVL